MARALLAGASLRSTTVTEVSSFDRIVSIVQLTDSISIPGSTVAQFCGETLYKRLTDLNSFEQRNYQDALKRVFLQTDEDLLNGE